MRRLISVLLFVAACGDNNATSPDAAPGDMPNDGNAIVPRAVAVGADYMSGTGTISKLEIDNLSMTQNLRAGAVQSDPVVRHFGNQVYVVNRYAGNNVTIFDAKTFQVIDQISTGANSNPQDVAVVGNKLYVPTLGGKGVVVLNRTTNTQTEIDLATPLGDPDGKPDCVSVYAVGTKLYVACSMTTNFSSVLDSKIAVIDTLTDTYVSSVVTPYKNPFGFFQKTPDGSTLTGDLLIPLVDLGDFSTNTPPNLTARCVARVSTGATLAVGCAIQNADLGGYPQNMAVSADGKTLYLAVAESYDVGKLRSYSLQTGTVDADPISKADEQIVDVAACPNGDVAASEWTPKKTGIRVFRGTTERTTAALPIGMQPVSTGLICYDAAGQ